MEAAVHTSLMVDSQAIGRRRLMSIGLSNSQRNLVLATAALGLFLTVATLLLRATLFPTAADKRLQQVRNTIDLQFMPYAAVIETFALQNPTLSVPIDKAGDCAHDYLKSLLTPAHPIIASQEAAEAARACMLDQVKTDEKQGRDDDLKEANGLAKLTGPMTAALAAVRH
jgi:hypothetical protein